MPLFMATYDLNTGHGTFLAEARKRPWDYWIKSSSGTWYRLPNTTIVGTFETRDEAVQSLKDTRAATESQLGVTILMPKWIVAKTDGTSFNSDETSQGS